MLYTDISDHCPIFVMTNMELRGEGIGKIQPKFKRNLNQHNLNRFEKALGAFDWSCISQISDTEIAYDRFVEYYSKMFSDCCPLQQVKIKKCNQPKKQWMTPALGCFLKMKSLRTMFSNPPLHYAGHREAVVKIIAQNNNI